MFERFTEQAKAVLVEAQDLAVELGSRYIGVIHLLYGCAEVRDDTAGAPLRELGVTGAAIRRLIPREDEPAAATVDADALRSVGIDYDIIRTTVEQTFGAGALDTAPVRSAATTCRRPPFTLAAKRSLELALRVALELHATRMLPGHLLLGILRLDDDHITGVLEQSSTSVATLSAAVLTGLSAAA